MDMDRDNRCYECGYDNQNSANSKSTNPINSLRVVMTMYGFGGGLLDRGINGSSLF